MKTLLGKSYRQISLRFKVNPEKHYHLAGASGPFSVFIDENEFVFTDDGLIGIEITNFSMANRIPGFNFPITTRLEATLALFEKTGLAWEVGKYSEDRWLIINLINEYVRYDFEFQNNRFHLRCICLEKSTPAMKK